LNKNLPFAKHQTEGAAAFDIAVRETRVIEPGTVAYVPFEYWR